MLHTWHILVVEVILNVQIFCGIHSYILEYNLKSKTVPTPKLFKCKHIFFFLNKALTGTLALG